ncbi:MAG: DnaJ domain-containing protein [Lyngbya sp.]|nr:DnaJ domain-containing protein [Lyngbya sp.]
MQLEETPAFNSEPFGKSLESIVGDRLRISAGECKNGLNKCKSSVQLEITVTGQKANSGYTNRSASEHRSWADTYYDLLGLHPSASSIDIRRAYRELSKRYHPDTTELSKATATAKFQQLNEAYATLSNPERRLAYDLKIRYSRYNVIQPSDPLNRSQASGSKRASSSAYLDPTDRPLSAGELFAVLMMALSLIACLILAIAIGLTRSEVSLEPIQPPGVLINTLLLVIANG